MARPAIKFDRIQVFPFNEVHELLSEAIYDYLYNSQKFYGIRKGGAYLASLTSIITGKPMLYQLLPTCTVIADFLTKKEANNIKEKNSLYVMFANSDTKDVVDYYSELLPSNSYVLTPLNLHEFDNFPELAMDLDGVITNDSIIDDDSDFPHVFSKLEPLYLPNNPVNIITARWDTWDDRTYTYSWLSKYKVSARKIHYVGGDNREALEGKIEAINDSGYKIFVESDYNLAQQISEKTKCLVIHFSTLTFFWKGEVLSERLTLKLDRNYVLFEDGKFTWF